MSRFPALWAVSFVLVSLSRLPAQDDGPPIVINSPDQATTFVSATIKAHALVWDKKKGQLLAHVVFVPLDESDQLGEEDDHDFRLPGVTFDEKKGLFFATSAHGEVIPVAKIKKTLFIRTIEPLANANVRIEHPHGNVSVVLEAISPTDPAMRAAAAGEPPAGGQVDADGNQVHAVDLRSLLH